MKRCILSFFTFVFLTMGMSVVANDARQTVYDAIPGDGILRYYRLALPITRSAFEQDLESDMEQVYVFWRECETFVNRMFVPLGFCFDVVEEPRLVMTSHNLIDENVYNAPSFGTELLDEAIGADAYDVGMWVTYRPLFEENSGLSILGGAYAHNTKGSGYAKTDQWVVAHEIGHLFGAVHTPTGEGSLMDTGGEFFSYPSIRQIRSMCCERNTAYYADEARTMLLGDNKGGNYTYGVKVDNASPKISVEAMSALYRIPQGSCLSINVQATDTDLLNYAAMGCDQRSVDNMTEGNEEVRLATLSPQQDNVVHYHPLYTADIYDDRYYYIVAGTELPTMTPGTYPLSILVNDVSTTSWDYDALRETPFYSQYAIWETQVEIVSGTDFSASLSPAKTSYVAGEQVQVSWGVNENYFDKDSRLRITMSRDYGRTFDYVLASSVPALDGCCTITLPNVNVGEVDVDFSTAVRTMRGGIIKIEEIGGAAYTLTTLSPEDNRNFVITGGLDPDEVTSVVPIHDDAATDGRYDLQGREVSSPLGGIYIQNGKKVVIR